MIRQTDAPFPGIWIVFVLYIAICIILGGLVLAVIFDKTQEQAKVEIANQASKQKVIEDKKVPVATWRNVYVDIWNNVRGLYVYAQEANR